MPSKKAVFIIAQNNFRDEELTISRSLLEQNNIQVVLAAPSLKSAKGMLGLKVQPDITLDQINVADYALVVFIGGSGAAQYWNDKTAHKIVRETLAQGKVLGALCLAPVTLAKAGVLNGKKCTVWPSERNQMEAGGGLTSGRPVETDGQIVTADGPGSTEKFARTLLEKIE